MIAGYLLLFCRTVIGLVFVVSFGGKVLNPPKFRDTILDFHLLPRQLGGFAAVFFLISEFAIVAGMALGGSFLFPAFTGALFLLFLFSSAIISVLARKMHTSCNCFGVSKKPVSPIDVWRNVGFGLCALGGCGALLWVQKIPTNAIGPMWMPVALGAGIFVLVWMQLGEIVQLFSNG